ncbi:MAG TPA: serine protease [Thermoanaerobaculia bacterium]|nr:serine protease [Thermoanaerobaculia bacterium]
MRESVVKVHSAGSRGTGFIIARGLVATALHVVAERRPDGITARAESCSLEFSRLSLWEGVWEQRDVPACLAPGAWDLDDDWALLQFDPGKLEGWDLRPAGLARLLEETVVNRRVMWSTWGFPDAHPRLGMDTGGHIRTVRAALDALTPGRDPVRAIQLYSEEAAAASGLPVRGLSGAPVLVEGNVVGLLRYSLLQPAADGEERRAQAGTLYATPIERLRDPGGGLFRWEDSDRLPPLDPRERLPEEPFRYLDRYEREHSRVFFGRGSDIRQLLSDLGRADLPAVGLLFGPMGAGKSSFLRAGIETRLADRKLHVAARGADGLPALWQVLREQAEGTDALPVIDQVEEAWTLGQGDEELATLLRAITEWLKTRPLRTGIQLLLSFREDRLSSVQDGLRRHGMRWHPFALRHLDARGLLETMTGFAGDPAVRDHYGIDFDPQELPQTIVDAVLTGNSGAVAPVLQVLLARLWARAKSRAEKEGAAVRTIRREDFELELAAAAGLRDFLERQLQAVEAVCPMSFQTGFALEVLREYTTPGGTAAGQDTGELAARYPANALVPVPRLVDEMAGAKLLYCDRPGSARMVHDSLAPVVQHAAAMSDRPAQRARRTLENRAVDWERERVGQPLDDADLRIAEEGGAVMRRLTKSEERLLEASRRARRGRQRARVALRSAAVLAMAAILGVSVWALRESRRSAEAERATARRLAEKWFSTAASDFDNRNDVLAAVLALSQAISVAPAGELSRSSYFARLLALAPTAPEFVSDLGPAVRAAVNANHKIAVLHRMEGAIETWDFASKKRLSSLPLPLGHGPHQDVDLPSVGDPVIRADGRYAAIATDTPAGLRLLIWEVPTGRFVLNEATDLIASPTFGPSGWVAQRSWKGLRVWNFEAPGHPRLVFPSGSEVDYLSSLAPGGPPRVAVALPGGGFEMIQLSSPPVVGRRLLQGSQVGRTGWAADGRLIAIAPRALGWQVHMCSATDCGVAAVEALPEDVPSHVGDPGPWIDPCGNVFGKGFFLDSNGYEVKLPRWPVLGRLCPLGNLLLGVTARDVEEGGRVTATDVEERGYSSIVECELAVGGCDSTGRMERRLPGGALAVDWTQDRRHLLTLSAAGIALRWPSAVRPPASIELGYANTGLAWPAFSRDGSRLAVGRSDHTGVAIYLHSLASGASVVSRVEFPKEGVPPELLHDPRFMQGYLRVMRFSADSTQLLVGVQGSRPRLSVVAASDGSVTELQRTEPLRTHDGLEDAFLLESSVIVVFSSRVAEQIPFQPTGAISRCELPSGARFDGFGAHGELLLRNQHRLEIWTVPACHAAASVAATGGSEELALALLREADGIKVGSGKLVVRFGCHEAEIRAEEDGRLVVSAGTAYFRTPSPADDRYRVVSVSRDLRRAILVHEDRLSKVSDVGVWDLEKGLRLDLSPPGEIVRGGAILTGQSWGAGFTGGGEELALLCGGGRLFRVPIGPGQVEKAAWMDRLDVGLTGLRRREDGGFYSPPGAADEIPAFRRELVAAERKGDRAAAALLRALERRQ